MKKEKKIEKLLYDDGEERFKVPQCLRCGTNKKFTIKKWNECPWQLADWRASIDFPLLPRFIVHWWYFRNNPKHLLK